MKRILFLFFYLFLIIIPVSSIGLATSISDWKTYETDDFIIFYPQGYEAQAKETLYYLSKYKSKVDTLTGNDNKIKTRIVIQDSGLLTDGEADPISVKISIFTCNPELFSNMISYDSWLRLVSVHEYTHISQMTNSSGTASSLTKIFGNYFSPNIHIPLWMMEGITVYSESQVSPYEGRLNGGYFDTFIASKAAEGKLPSILEANYGHNHFPFGQYYLYGGEFFKYLAATYGEEKITQFFNEYGSYYWTPIIGDFFPALGIDKAAKKIYGKTFPQLFEEWQLNETNKYKDWKISGTAVVKNKLGGSIYGLNYAKKKLYYFKVKRITPGPFRYFELYNLVEYDLQNNKERILKTFSEPWNGMIQIVNNKLYFSLLDKSGENAILHSYDLKTNQIQKILKDDFNDFTVLDDEIIIYAKKNKDKYGSEIWKYSNKDKQKIGITLELISEMKSYQDKFIVVSKEAVGSYGIKYLNIDDLSLEAIIDTPYAEANMNLIGDKLYYNSNYQGFTTTYQYDLYKKKLVEFTDGNNSIRGIQALDYKDNLYFTSISAEEINLYKTPLNYEPVPIPKTENVESDVDLADLDIEIKEGNGLSKSLSYLLKPNIRLFPSLLAGQDALGLNSYSIDYSDDGLDYYFNSQMLLPFTISHATPDDDDEERETKLDLFLPLSSNVILDYNTNFSEDAIPGIRFLLPSVRQNLALYLQTNVNSDGVNSELNYSYLFDNSSIIFQGSKFEDFEKDADIRGFDFDDFDNGYQGSLEYLYKLAEIKKGLWNPNIFIGDIYASVFVDYFNDTDLDNEESAYGYELSFEIGMAQQIHFVPMIGVAVSDDDTEKYLGFKILGFF
ncbi:hypothetical protein GM661_14415 [Iocasia frigidifontis]|uniref:Uncharacterized protein n=1 Tax=Iocasia fonsfrigidae TaxID=2682810 RepID=A0A8A7KB96_9FIRM|nr:hypothetical protein [Iocasia fonsfrigidae]QTL99066.1 hypothetical protein GM661_14415 [Iocasia fonsfrigidae]